MGEVEKSSRRRRQIYGSSVKWCALSGGLSCNAWSSQVYLFYSYFIYQDFHMPLHKPYIKDSENIRYGTYQWAPDMILLSWYVFLQYLKGPLCWFTTISVSNCHSMTYLNTFTLVSTLYLGGGLYSPPPYPTPDDTVAGRAAALEFFWFQIAL